MTLVSAIIHGPCLISTTIVTVNRSLMNLLSLLRWTDRLKLVVRLTIICQLRIIIKPWLSVNRHIYNFLSVLILKNALGNEGTVVRVLRDGCKHRGVSCVLTARGIGPLMKLLFEVILNFRVT